MFNMRSFETFKLIFKQSRWFEEKWTLITCTVWNTELKQIADVQTLFLSLLASVIRLKETAAHQYTVSVNSSVFSIACLFV